MVQAADGVDDLIPLEWTSSADLVGLTRAQGLAVTEAGTSVGDGAFTRFRPLGLDPVRALERGARTW